MRVTLKAINDELRELGTDARLAKGDGYFYFYMGEAADWLNPTVQAPKVSSLTLEQWIDEFKKLRQLNAKLSGGKARMPRRRLTPRSAG